MSGNSSKMALSEVLAISLHKEMPFNADVRLLKIRRKSCQFTVRMVKSARHGATVTIHATFLDNRFLLLPPLTPMKGGSYITD